MSKRQSSHIKHDRGSSVSCTNAKKLSIALENSRKISKTDFVDNVSTHLCKFLYMCMPNNLDYKLEHHMHTLNHKFNPIISHLKIYF